MSLNLSGPQQLALYERMQLIRKAEERLGADSRAGVLPGNVHLYIGQEAIATGVCAHLTDRDSITSTHRGHGHFLAKGGDVGALIAEVYGRAEGACHGMGGSMHVADLSKGILGANGIVGGGIAISAGSAFAALLDAEGAVAVSFFGDGASSQGVLSEVMNIAALWHLPLILVCEHNGFSEFSPSATVNAGQIADRARPYGLPAHVVDGNDVLAMWQVADEAIGRARAGKGATFIEAVSYRTRGHLEAEGTFIQKPYRSQDEIAQWEARCPILRLSNRLIAEKMATPESLAAIDSQVAMQIDAAVSAAQSGTDPSEALAMSCAIFDIAS